MSRITPLPRILGWHLLVYGLWWATCLFFAAGGHGSLLPLALFWGWATVAYRTLQPWLGKSDAWVFALAAIQLVAYGLAWQWFRRRNLRWPIVIWLPLTHLLGSALMAWQQPLEELRFFERHAVTAAISWLSAVLVFSAYWLIYLWRLTDKRLWRLQDQPKEGG